MGSNADTHDIMGFSQGFHNGEHAPGQTSSFSHHDPRWAPLLANTGLASTWDSYHHFDDATDDGQSEYTTASTEPSRAYTATTAMRSNASSSVFSSRSGGPSSVEQSSAPSVGYAGPTFVQQFANPDLGAGAGAGARHDELWCEFSELLCCNATFRLDNELGWINHHVQHLQDSYPRKLMCWFCDHVPFVARSDEYGDTSTNFHERMLHIREHIFGDERRWTSQHVRPDFCLVEHLYRRRRIPDRMYRYAMKYEETPPEFRLPGTSSSSSSTRPAPRRHQERGEFYDLEKEKRRSRERQHGVSSRANKRR